MDEHQDVEVTPTVLDWFVSLLRLKPIPIPEPGAAPAAPVPVPTQKEDVEPVGEGLQLRVEHIRIPVALLFALLAQIGLSNQSDPLMFGAMYLVSAALAGWGVWAGDFGEIVRPAVATRKRGVQVTYDIRWLVPGLAAAVLTYLTSSENTFRVSTIAFGIAAVLMTGRAFWVGKLPGSRLPASFKKFAAKPELRIRLGAWSLLVVSVFMLSAFVRFADLAEVPYAMWSDHAEKYLDIVDVLNGKTSIFFPRNAGREPIQFYATAAAIKWFGASYSFETLKAITALAGLLTLPFLYLFGKEVGGRWVGLSSMALAGIAFWPNLISRVGMRLPFFPLLLAPALYYMLRGFRTRKQNDFVVTGILLGISLYGYTAARIAPLVIGLALALYLAHRVSQGHRAQAVGWIGIAALLAFIVAVPLARVTLEFQDEVLYRSLTRVSDIERALPGEPLDLFATNMRNALRMFSWDFGEIWIMSLRDRPALDWVTGALFHVGIAMVVARYAKSRNWVDLLVLLSIPVLLLPSVLSLAFPGENPHPSRAGGAIVPVFTVAGIALAGIWQWSKAAYKAPWSGGIGWGTIGFLFVISTATNYGLVSGEYGDQMRRDTWNTAQAAEVVKNFTSSVGVFEDVHMIAYPHWMDSRLVALLAGRPGSDIVLWPDQIDELIEVNTPQLFMLHHADQAGLERLQARYPGGLTQYHLAEVEGRDFITYLVPGDES